MTAARAHLFVIRMAAFYACLDEGDQHRESQAALQPYRSRDPHESGVMTATPELLGFYDNNKG